MLAAASLCPPNKRSAAKKAWYAINNPINNPIYNPKNNLKNNPKNNPENKPINNPIDSLKRKMDNRDANLQAVLDDPDISTTLKMCTSATVPLLTDIAWTDLHA